MGHSKLLSIIISLPCVISILFLTSCESEENTDSNKVELSTNEKVHTFYYNWYGSTTMDGTPFHWKHDILPHWSDTTWDHAGGFPGGEDIGANYYPQIGCYSSNDKTVIREHMKMIQEAGIGVLVITWWGIQSYEDKSIQKYLDAAEDFNLKVAFHIEPFYKTIDEFKSSIEYINTTYGNHPASYKVDDKLFYYVYDSYKISAEDWSKVLTPNGEMSLRGTSSDGTFIGLWVNENEHEFFLNSGFDGFYTYFASDGFVYGSTSKNWKIISKFAKENDLIFIPCAGPGYIDTRIRPWNAANIKDRERGAYYENMFTVAVQSKPNYIGITSFNEWHEGTQLEPARAKSIDGYTYEDYDEDPWFYIHKTKSLIDSLFKN